jgi:hypothetical protein
MIFNITSKARRLSLLLAAAIVLVTAVPASARADQVLWSTRDLLKDFFNRSQRVNYIEVQGAAAADELKRQLGYLPPKASYTIFQAWTGDHLDGYAVIDEEPGQHLPITFGVKVSPEGKLERLEVMVYREAYGSEIRDERFRQQFVGHDDTSSLRAGGDIVAISGATLSSRAMASGAKRALALVSIARRLPARGSTASR